MDSGKWHPRESFLRGDLLAASAQATAIQIHYFLFPRARNGGQFIYGHRLLLFSGLTNFGDWAAVIRGLQPHWIWRLGLTLLGVASYYASMLVVANKLKQFHAKDESSHRLRRLSWTPYFTDGILAGVAGVFNPAGLFYVIASALPSTLGQTRVC